MFLCCFLKLRWTSWCAASTLLAAFAAVNLVGHAHLNGNRFADGLHHGWPFHFAKRWVELGPGLPIFDFSPMPPPLWTNQHLQIGSLSWWMIGTNAVFALAIILGTVYQVEKWARTLELRLTVLDLLTLMAIAGALCASLLEEWGDKFRWRDAFWYDVRTVSLFVIPIGIGLAVRTLVELFAQIIKQGILRTEGSNH